MNTSQLADRMQEDQGEDGENNTYEDVTSLNDLYPVDGGDNNNNGKNKYQKLFFLQDCFSRH